MAEHFIVITDMTLEEAFEALELEGGDKWFARVEYAGCGSHAVHLVWEGPDKLLQPVPSLDRMALKPAPASAPVFDHTLLDVPE